jgi:hypothetical protein
VSQQSTRCVAKEEKSRRELGIIVRFPKACKKKVREYFEIFRIIGGRKFSVWQRRDWLCQCKAHINSNIVRFLFATNQQSLLCTKEVRTPEDPTLIMALSGPDRQTASEYVGIARNAAAADRNRSHI